MPMSGAHPRRTPPTRQTAPLAVQALVSAEADRSDMCLVQQRLALAGTHRGASAPHVACDDVERVLSRLGLRDCRKSPAGRLEGLPGDLQERDGLSACLTRSCSVAQLPGHPTLEKVC